ncbi:MAG: N-acetyltransferase [Oscillospiraceae bacterium]|nr:N-acetyltransferase [Oscillospiraceae bacterium]
MEIRFAVKEDAAAIREIYAPYVTDTAVTFEYDVPDEAEFVCRIENTLKEYPYLVGVENGRVIGYAYAGSFHSRAAYKHSAEVSIYLERSQHGKGIGSLLYRELEKILIRQNVFLLCACITVTERENDAHLTDASVRFHRKNGYALVGKHELCGYKFDKWYSIVWMEKLIAERVSDPEPFLPFSRLNV